MCFPGKRQKALLSDEPESSTKKAAPPVKETPAPAPVTPVATTEVAKMSSPKVAIVIYSMYGHIAKCEYPFTTVVLHSY